MHLRVPFCFLFSSFSRCIRFYISMRIGVYNIEWKKLENLMYSYFESKGEEDEPPEALDMGWPSGTRKRLTYILVAPIIFPLWLTLPDTRTPRGKSIFLPLQIYIGNFLASLSPALIQTLHLGKIARKVFDTCIWDTRGFDIENITLISNSYICNEITQNQFQCMDFSSLFDIVFNWYARAREKKICTILMKLVIVLKFTNYLLRLTTTWFNYVIISIF